MKKVYLVFASIFFKDGSHSSILLYAFRSYKKARIYAEYKELVIKRDGVDRVFGGSDIDFVSIRVDTEPVVNFDWSYDLKELQDEKL